MSNVSLQEMLQRRTLPAKPLQLAILRQIAVQLDEAHQRRLIHGNLNPQNILLSETQADGGMSVFVKGFGGRFDMDPGAMSGPPPVEAYYLSPEQVLGIDPTPQSDEFSFAAIAYELLSGSRPFTAAKLSGLIFAICSDPPKPVDELDGSLSTGVSSVLTRALAKDSQSRYPTCGQFAAALENELVRCSGWNQSEAVIEPLAVAATAAASQTASEPEAIPIAAPSRSFAATPFEAPSFEAPRFQSPEFAPRAETEQPPVIPEQAERIFHPAPPPFVPIPEPPAAAPIRSAYDLPPVRRRNHYEDPDEPTPTRSPLKKFAIAGLVLFVLAAAALFFFNASPKSDLPTQVLDTKNAPVTPPPAKDESAPAQTQAAAPSPAPGASSTAVQQPAAPPVANRSSQSEPPPQDQSTASRAAPRVREPVQMPPAKTPAQVLPAARHSAGGGLVDVELLSEPPGASILIDNNPALACRAPCDISLSDGRHTLSASLAGYTLAQRIFNVPETSSVFVTMPRLTGALVVTSNPSAATILIDGKDYGLTPATLHLPPGQHRVTLMNGSQRHDAEVTVVADGIQATGYTFAQ